MMSFDDDPPKPDKKHKTKASGFLMFLLEFRRIEADNGNPIEMAEAQVLAGKKWDEMLPEQRERYNKTKPTANRPDPKKLYTSFGVSFDEIDRQKKEEIQRIKNMELTIEEMLQNSQEKNQLKSLEFYFFSTSFYVQTLKNDIFPAEIAMSKFSLKEGVTDTLHMLVNPGALPIGMASDAQRMASERHRRSLPPNIEGEEDYCVMFEKIMDFLGVKDVEGGTHILMIFVEPGLNDVDYKAAKLTLEKIVREANQYNIEFRLYPIENLLFRLQKKCVESHNAATGSNEKPFLSVLFAKNKMASDPFMYSAHGCKFHNDEDADYLCCLAKVKRWGFTVASFCLRGNDEKIPGRHIPEEAKVQDVDDASSNESGWESRLSDSMMNLRVESRTSMSQSSMPPLGPASSKVSLYSNKAISRSEKVSQDSDLDQTDQPTPSVVSAIHPVNSDMSFSTLLKEGRRGARGSASTRGGKR